MSVHHSFHHVFGQITGKLRWQIRTTNSETLGGVRFEIIEFEFSEWKLQGLLIRTSLIHIYGN